MDIQHLLKHSRSYELLRRYAVFAHSLFYEEVCVINKENVPDNEPVIFAPNHQNALMDALAIICTLNKQPVFMARADIFKKPTIEKILSFLKIIPVYRIRDGYDNLSNNDESFDVALQVLRNNKTVGIMPEGNHGDQRRLRPLKKGLSRFALQVQEKLGKSNKLIIIPVGLDYSHYANFRSKLLVIYGNPIDITELLEEYAQNPQKAMNILRERLTEEMKNYMLNIDNNEYYSLICKLTGLYVGKLKTRLEAEDGIYDHFQVEKIISDKLVILAKENPESLKQLSPMVDEFYSNMRQIKITDEVLEIEIPNQKSIYYDVLRYILYLPLAIISTLFHIIPVSIIKYLSGRVKDSQFISSFKFTLGLIIFPIYYLLMLALPLPIYTKILLLLIMPVLGVLTFDYSVSLKKFWIKLRFIKLKNDKNFKLIRIKQLKGEIIAILEKLI